MPALIRHPSHRDKESRIPAFSASCNPIFLTLASIAVPSTEINSMGILTLPFDVLQEILQLASPYDFEAFVLSCKFIYSTLQPLLQTHNSLRKRYRSVKLPKRNVWDDDESVMPYTIPQLLCEIAAQPRIAEYIVHLDLANREELDSIIQQSRWADTVCDSIDAVSDSLLELLQQSAYLRQLRASPKQIFACLECITKEKIEMQENHQLDFCVPFLLSLLPNIESLALSGFWAISNVTKDPEVGYDDYDDEEEGDQARRNNALVRDLVKLLVDRANDEELSDQPLSKLHTLHPTRDIDQQYGDDIVTIFPLLSLKSLRRVYHVDGTLDLQLDDNDEAENDDEDEDEDEDGDDDEGDDEQDDEDEDDAESNAGSEGSDDVSNQSEEEEMDQDDEDEDDHSASEGEIEFYPRESVWKRYTVLGPNIEHMVLEKCVIDANASSKFFQNMKKLKTLHYRHTTKEGFGQEWDPDCFVQGVAAGAGQSLEKLLILADWVWDDCLALHSPLHNFPKLQHLEIDATFLVVEDEPEATSALVDILPSSLQTLIIHMTANKYECLERLVAGFKDARKDLFPALTHVELRFAKSDRLGCSVDDYEDRLSTVQSVADANGIIVTAVKSDEEEEE